MSDDIQDRMAARFDDETDKSEKSAKSEQSNKSDGSDMNTQSVEAGVESDERDKSVWNVENVKDDWRAIQSFVPEELHEQWNDEFDRIRYLSDEDWQKDRDFKPLIFFAALEQLGEMDGEEIDALRERMRDEIQ